MGTDPEARLRALSPEQFQFVAGAVLEAIGDANEVAATDAELKAAADRDAAVIREVAASIGVEGGIAGAEALDGAALLAAAAAANEEAHSALEKALVRIAKPDVRLPVLGLGGVEILLLAIAAAIVRPKLEIERKTTASGAAETKIQVAFQGTRQIDKVIRAAASLLPRIGST